MIFTGHADEWRKNKIESAGTCSKMMVVWLFGVIARIFVRAHLLANLQLTSNLCACLRAYVCALVVSV